MTDCVVYLLLIEAIDSTCDRSMFVGITHGSRQFPFRSENGIFSYVNTSNVFIASGVQNRYAPDRREIRIHVTVASQMGEIRLFTGAIHRLRNRIDNHMNDLSPSNVRLPIRIAGILIGLVHRCLHVCHQLIEHGCEISHHTISQDVVSYITWFRSTRIIIDQGVIFD